MWQNTIGVIELHSCVLIIVYKTQIVLRFDFVLFLRESAVIVVLDGICENLACLNGGGFSRKHGQSIMQNDGFDKGK